VLTDTPCVVQVVFLPGNMKRTRGKSLADTQGKNRQCTGRTHYLHREVARRILWLPI